MHSVRLGWNNLTTVQQWMREHILGIEPATEDEKPKPRRSQAEKWAFNYEAARQSYEREGHLRGPRKHVETIMVGLDGEDHEERARARGARIARWVTMSDQSSPCAAKRGGFEVECPILPVR